MTRLQFVRDQSDPIQIHDSWTEHFYDGSVSVIDGIAETDNRQYEEVLRTRGYRDVVETDETVVSEQPTPPSKAVSPPRRAAKIT